MSALSNDQHKCFLDDTEGCPHCVFDEGDTDACDVAYGLNEQGLSKSDCPHWLHPQSMRDRLIRIAAEHESRCRIQIAAKKKQAEIIAGGMIELERRPGGDEDPQGWWVKPEIRGC